jgi:hypothetical protein
VLGAKSYSIELDEDEGIVDRRSAKALMRSLRARADEIIAANRTEVGLVQRELPPLRPPHHFSLQHVTILDLEDNKRPTPAEELTTAISCIAGHLTEVP